MIQIINQPLMIYYLCHWLLDAKYPELACSITSFPHLFLLSLLNIKDDIVIFNNSNEYFLISFYQQGCVLETEDAKILCRPSESLQYT